MPDASPSPEPSAKSTTAPTPPNTPSPGRKQGDVDCADIVDEADALAILAWLADVEFEVFDDPCTPIGVAS